MMRRALFLIILLCLAVSLVPSCKVPPKHYKLTELDDRVGQSARVSPDGRYLSDEDEEAEGVWDLKSGKKHPTGSGLGPFTFSSASVGIGVHLRPESAFTMDRNTHGSRSVRTHGRTRASGGLSPARLAARRGLGCGRRSPLHGTRPSRAA